MGEAIHDAKKFGWEVEPEKIKHNWGTMVQNIQDYIGGLNWGYKVELRDKNVKYLNAYGVIQDAHTVKGMIFLRQHLAFHLISFQDDFTRFHIN